MRRLLVIIAVLLAGIFVYVVPGLTELALIRQHLNPWLSCVLLGDMAGCVTLYLLGRRVTAVLLYVISSTLEAVLLSFQLLSPLSLVWFSNSIPALAISFILLRAGRRNIAVEEY